MSYPKIAIIGGGASGTLVAAQLLRQATCPIQILLYDPAPLLGRGLAYGTRDSSHLLNVPAGKMTALPDDPEHFLRWLNASSEKEVAAGEFVPRATYAKYLHAVLAHEIKDAEARDAHFEHHRESVLDFIPAESGGTIVTTSADTEDVNYAVLALGNLPPRHPLPHAHAFFRSSRYIPSVWTSEWLEKISPREDLLLVGSGLTALDTICSLHRRGHRGHIFLTSRNGRLPEPHAPGVPYADFLAGRDFPATIRAWVRLVRGEIRQAAEAGVGWRPVLDALRPHTQRIWVSLNDGERRRFLRHVRAIWESHRHRAPAQVRAVIDRLREDGQLRFIPGRIRNFKETRGKAQALICPKGGGPLVTLEVSHVANCIGPESNFRQSLNDPLIINLIARGVLHPDSLFLGLEATPEGHPIGTEKRVYSQISTLGPPLRGMLWETTAMPEIRQQAKQLAAHILSGLADVSS